MKEIMKKLYYLCHYIWLRARIVVAAGARGPRIWLLGTPIHNNIGDLAIMKAEIEFIKQRLPYASIVEIPMPFLLRWPHLLSNYVKDEDVIAGHGGGNFGDTYKEEEECRRYFIEQFPYNKIVLFPQTAYFSDSVAGHAELAKSVAIYSRHRNITLIAREDISYAFMKEHFKNNEILLTPDIVLSMNPKLSLSGRSGALTCIRSDVESILSSEERDRLVGWINNTYKNDVRTTDTIASERFFLLKPRNWVVKSKLREFSRAEFVLTDRLHGMVFAAITGTPCVALANFNHKVRGTYAWIKNLGYIRYCETIDEVIKTDTAQLTASARPYNPDRFDDYWQKIEAVFKGSGE